MLERIRDRLPDAQIVELPDVGHYPQLETPAVVAEEIAAMLARIEPARP
jgi:pimeloyl-ACP methyl ester carboxylesterase